MSFPDLDDHFDDPVDGPPFAEVRVAEVRIAAAAADAARGTPGVLRLQPGIWGLVQQLGRDLWTRVTARPYPDIAGVDVSVASDTTTVDITLVCDGHRPAAVIAGEVQRNVHRAVLEICEIVPTRIAVHVLDIAPPAEPRSPGPS